jgi:cell division protein FtsI/penicillin-binding protein 2
MTQPPKPIISFVHPQAANLQKAFSAGNLLDDVDKSEEEVSDSELDDLFGSKPKQRKKRGPPARKELKSSKKIKLDDNVKSDELGTSDTLNYRKDEKANPLKKSGDKKQGINIKPAKKAEELLIISDSDSEDGVPDVNQILDENSNSKSTEQPVVRNKIKVKPVYVDENTLRQDPSIASSFNALKYVLTITNNLYNHSQSLRDRRIGYRSAPCLMFFFQRTTCT